MNAAGAIDAYRKLAGELAEAGRERDAECAAAQRVYADGCAVLADEVTRAHLAGVRAQERLASSVAVLAATDERADRYWAELSARPRRRSRRGRAGPTQETTGPDDRVAGRGANGHPIVGTPPARPDVGRQPNRETPPARRDAGSPPIVGTPPARPDTANRRVAERRATGQPVGDRPVPDGQVSGRSPGVRRPSGGTGVGVPDDRRKPTAVRSPADLLDRVAACLEAVRREPPVMTLPAGFLFLVPSLGAIASALVAGLGKVTSGGQLGLDILGQVLVFLAPFAGIPVTVWLARYRYGGRPDAGAIGLTALGGMIACCAMVVALG